MTTRKLQLPALVELSERLKQGILADPVKSLLSFVEAGVGTTDVEASGFFLATGLTKEQRFEAFEIVLQIIVAILKQVPKHARKRAHALLCSNSAVAMLPRRVNSETLSTELRQSLSKVYEALVRYTDGKLNQAKTPSTVKVQAAVSAKYDPDSDEFGNEFVQSILKQVMSSNQALGSQMSSVFQTEVKIVKDGVKFHPGVGMAAAFRQKQLQQTLDSPLSPVRLGKMLSPSTSIKQEFLDLQADQRERNGSLKKLKPLTNPRVEARARQVAAGYRSRGVAHRVAVAEQCLISPYSEDLMYSMRTKRTKIPRQEAVRQYMETMTRKGAPEPALGPVIGSNAQFAPCHHARTQPSMQDSSATTLHFEKVFDESVQNDTAQRSIVDEYMVLYRQKMDEYESEMRMTIPPSTLPPTAVSLGFGDRHDGSWSRRLPRSQAAALPAAAAAAATDSTLATAMSSDVTVSSQMRTHGSAMGSESPTEEHTVPWKTAQTGLHGKESQQDASVTPEPQVGHAVNNILTAMVRAAAASGKKQ